LPAFPENTAFHELAMVEPPRAMATDHPVVAEVPPFLRVTLAP
jgi:hypothetical protein